MQQVPPGRSEGNHAAPSRFLFPWTYPMAEGSRSEYRSAMLTPMRSAAQEIGRHSRFLCHPKVTHHEPCHPQLAPPAQRMPVTIPWAGFPGHRFARLLCLDVVDREPLMRNRRKIPTIGSTTRGPSVPGGRFATSGRAVPFRFSFPAPRRSRAPGPRPPIREGPAR